LKPEPAIETVVPAAPKVGERIILALTVNAPSNVFSVRPPATDVTTMVYAPYVDPAPTLNCAEEIVPVLLLKVHVIWLTFNCVPVTAVAVMMHVVSEPEPVRVPVMVTKSPTMEPVGGEPLVVEITSSTAWTVGVMTDETDTRSAEVTSNSARYIEPGLRLVNSTHAAESTGSHYLTLHN
jgi:hypothetical protein